MRALFALSFALAACTPVDAKRYGEQLFHDSEFAGSQFNVWSCATCHRTGEAVDSRMLPGAPLAGVLQRPRFWGGAVARPIDAASFCYVAFMRGPEALRADEPRSRALFEYLESLPGGATETQPFTLVRNVSALPAGDANAGAATYANACQGCHGEKGSGKGRASTLASVLPDVQNDYPTLFPGVKPSLVFIEKVRHGQFLGVGGNMPPFSTETLSDAQLADLLAYLGVE